MKRRSSYWIATRLCLERWRRLTRWEFWPAWVVYPPILLHVLALAIRHRGLHVFAACNPAIPGGGFIGESKSRILDQIGQQEFVAQGKCIPAASRDKAQQALNFMAWNRLAFPIVAKPDAGQRGLGVAVLHNEAQLRDYFDVVRPDTIVQEYAPGPEFGLFYVRLPGEPYGHIFSLTEKRPTTVTGDGRSTLRELILADDRAVCSARFFLRLHRERLDEVPPQGELVALSEIGNHCRGAIFCDGRHLVTPAMEAVIDRVARSFDGFFFGRFDLRTPSLEDFRRGRNFKIVELNGVTSEATHIYDPRHGFRYAQRILREQWRIAFQIGAANLAQGVQAASLRELVGMLSQYEPAREA